MSTVQETILSRVTAAAQEFAQGIVTGILNMSVAEMGELNMSEMQEAFTNGPALPVNARKAMAAGKAPAAKAPAAKPGRLARRTPEQLEAFDASIVKFVRKAGKDGATAEQIREGLGCDRRELATRLGKVGLRTKGNKRATTYFAKPARKAAKKPAKKVTRKAKGRK